MELNNYETALKREFSLLNTKNFYVTFSPPIIFVCGGKADNKKPIPQSMRERIFTHFNIHEKELFTYCLKAEDFKDYFKDDAYNDLLEFEEDIANISTLIIICLESPGSLVELGMFSSSKSILGRLVILAPSEEVESEDSFIFLGPLSYLSKKDELSVLTYPWPDNSVEKYNHMNMITLDIHKKLKKIDKKVKFLTDNSGHIAMLIYDIIHISHPIKQHEILLALDSMGIIFSNERLSKILYLLEKVNLISHTIYSHVKYFFDIKDTIRRIRFGKTIKNTIKDTPSLMMAIRQSYVITDNEQSKKRSYALAQINKIKERDI